MKGGNMYTSITVGQVLKRKGNNYYSITPHSTVYDALAVMAEKDIGALLVVEHGKLVGIFSERDYARKVILKGKSSKETLVSELMSSPAICAGPRLTLRDCMLLMDANHIRHLPILEGGLIFGILSIRDVVDAIISDQAMAIEELENYISGSGYPQHVTS